MTKRPSRIRKSDATNFMKSALGAGFGRVRAVERDGRFEYIAEKEGIATIEDRPPATASEDPNPWDELAN